MKPGEKLTITYTLAHDLDYMTALDIVLRYDATLFQFVSTDIDGSVWFDNPTQNGAYGADSQALVRMMTMKKLLLRVKSVPLPLLL